MKIILTIIAVILLQLTMTHLLRRDKPENHIEGTISVITPLSNYGVETRTTYDKSGLNVLKYTDFVTGKAITADSAISQGRLNGNFQFRLNFDNLHSVITVPAKATQENSDIIDLIKDIEDALSKKGLQNELKVQEQNGKVVVLYNVFRGKGSEFYRIPEISIVKTKDDESFSQFGFDDSVVANDYDMTITIEDSIRYDIALNKSISRAKAHSSEVTLLHIDQEIQAQTDKSISLLKEENGYSITKDGGVILINRSNGRFKVTQANNSQIVKKLGLVTEGKGFALTHPQINLHRN